MADAAVNEFAAAGWKFIKVYDRLSPEVYRVIERRAAALGIRVVGHVPFAVTLEQALAQGQASLEHLIGYERGLGGWAWTERLRSRAPYPGDARGRRVELSHARDPHQAHRRHAQRGRRSSPTVAGWCESCTRPARGSSSARTRGST